MSDLFDIKEYVVDGQHIREYARATAHSQEEVLHLAVKQYIPKDNTTPKPGDITIVTSHANCFPKEIYEPLWEDLLHACRQNGVNIRGIWAADPAWQGQSGIINEDKLGNDPSWLDHARDLLHLINVFRAAMLRPIIGLGHSFGGCTITNVALMHPRLFSGLVMIDPVMSRRNHLGPLYGFNLLRLSASRRDLWPSRADAVRFAHTSKFYATWDVRAVERLAQYGYRDCPTELYPDRRDGEVTLVSTKHQECFTYYRPTHLGPRDPVTGERVLDRSLIPDATEDVDNFPNFPFYQPVNPATAARLGELRPSVLWIAGKESKICSPETMQEYMEITGYGHGGSGGAKAGKVKEFLVEGAGHMVAVEEPKAIAIQAARFIREEVDGWRREEEVYTKDWVKGVEDREKRIMSTAFIEVINSVGPDASRRKDDMIAGGTSKL